MLAVLLTLHIAHLPHFLIYFRFLYFTFSSYVSSFFFNYYLPLSPLHLCYDSAHFITPSPYPPPTSVCSYPLGHSYIFYFILIPLPFYIFIILFGIIDSLVLAFLFFLILCSFAVIVVPTPEFSHPPSSSFPSCIMVPYSCPLSVIHYTSSVSSSFILGPLFY